jgi:hypothetical protein
MLSDPLMQETVCSGLDERLVFEVIDASVVATQPGAADPNPDPNPGDH